MKHTLTTLSIALALLGASSSTMGETRQIYVISDLHMGLGYADETAGMWYPTEDFRWSNALKGFLDAVSPPGGRSIDLVIAGDFLELWQPPDHVKCEPVSLEYGCSVEELEETTRTVVAAHARELSELSRFAARQGNCLIVVPGNHDAALLVDDVWQILEKSLSSAGGCVKRAASGVWISGDGQVSVEHGHQFKTDANRYREWPDIIRTFGDTRYVERPWGEGFVQSIFNGQEQTYVLIDNLSPMSAGVRYRNAERSAWEKASDFVRFMKFNLLETSVRTEVTFLGETTEVAPVNVASGRRLGYGLFVGALPPEDPLRARLEAADGEWVDLRAELTRMAQDPDQLSDEEVRTLCEQALARGIDHCRPRTLGGRVVELIVPRKHIIKQHVRERWTTNKKMRTFVYGHTHRFEKEWRAPISSLLSVRVLNSGAFQRVIDDEKFLELAKSKAITPTELLKLYSLEDLPACYTAVSVDFEQGYARQQLKTWFMRETDSEGQFIDPCDRRCAAVGHGCN